MTQQNQNISGLMYDVTEIVCFTSLYLLGDLELAAKKHDISCEVLLVNINKLESTLGEELFIIDPLTKKTETTYACENLFSYICSIKAEKLNEFDTRVKLLEIIEGSVHFGTQTNEDLYG
jgi:hypothetical protein